MELGGGEQPQGRRRSFPIRRNDLELSRATVMAARHKAALPNSVMPAPSDDPCCATFSRFPVTICLSRRANHYAAVKTTVQPPNKKYFAFTEMQIRCREGYLVPTRGAHRGRHGRRVRDAMDAALRKTSADRRGQPSRVVPIPRRWGQACGRLHGRRWLSSPAHRGEREAAVNTIARGMPACFGVPAVTNSRDYHSTREAAGAMGTRHSPHPPYDEGHI